jgi:hypothetical protein
MAPAYFVARCITRRPTLSRKPLEEAQELVETADTGVGRDLLPDRIELAAGVQLDLPLPVVRIDETLDAEIAVALTGDIERQVEPADLGVEGALSLRAYRRSAVFDLGRGIGRVWCCMQR